MIQRVQSLLLLAISVLLIVFLFVPIWERQVTTETGTEKLSLNAFKASHSRGEQVVAEKNVWYIAAVALLAAGVAFYSTFQYKKRLRQIKLGLLNALLMSAVLGSVFLGISQANDLAKGEKEEEFLIGFFFPIIALILNLIANRFIRKDENLVRSADRIR
jgi:glucan phosphoethanolaminetransferase (alkaline phosphatase superfamily)